LLQSTIFAQDKYFLMHIFLFFLFSAIYPNSLIVPVSTYHGQAIKGNTSVYSHDTLLNKTSNHETKTRKAKNKNQSKAYNGEKAANRRAIWGFIFGCASILLFPLLCIPGLILSNDAIWEERMRPGTLTRTNKTRAYLGKIFSYIGIAIMIVAILYLAFIVAFLSAWG